MKDILRVLFTPHVFCVLRQCMGFFSSRGASFQSFRTRPYALHDIQTILLGLDYHTCISLHRCACVLVFCIFSFVPSVFLDVLLALLIKRLYFPFDQQCVTFHKTFRRDVCIMFAVCAFTVLWQLTGIWHFRTILLFGIHILYDINLCPFCLEGRTVRFTVRKRWGYFLTMALFSTWSLDIFFQLLI